MTVWVVGNAALDRTYRVPALPPAGASVLATQVATDIGGKGLNQAIMAARAGAKVRLLTAIGIDRGGDLILEALLEEAIDLQGVQQVDAPTDESLILIDGQGENAIVTTSNAIAAVALPSLTTALEAADRGDWLLLQGNTRHDVDAEMIARARQLGLRVALNPSPLRPTHAQMAGKVDLLVLNHLEAGAIDPTSASLAIVTAGAGGATLHAHGTVRHIPAKVVDVVDTVGAGDVLAGVTIGRLSVGDTIEVALNWGMAAAGLQVQRHGTRQAFPTREDLQRLAPAGTIIA